MDRCNVGLVNFALGSGSLARSLVAITETSVSNTVSLQADKVQLASTILMEKTSVGSTAYVGSSMFNRSNLLMNKCNFGWNVEIHPTVFDLSYLRMSSCNCGHRIYTLSASRYELNHRVRVQRPRLQRCFCEWDVLPTRHRLQVLRVPKHHCQCNRQPPSRARERICRVRP